jgi:cytosine/adenosine deaminase-related metal-dependent hydrolase
MLLAACGGKSASTTDAAGSGSADAAIDGSTTNPDAMVSGVVQCPTAVPAPTTGTCDATKGTGTAVLIRGNVLGDGVVYQDGGVLYDGETIVYVGCDYAGQAAAATATHIDCGGAAISPGLINAHDHLNYDNQWPLAATAAGGVRYQHRHDWRLTISTPSNQFGTGAASEGMRWNEIRQAMNGTTSMAASTRATGMVRNLDEPEALDTSEGLKGLLYEVFMLGDSNGTFKPNCAWTYKHSEIEVAQLHGTVTHTSEGINDYAHQEFLCQSTSSSGARDFTEKNVAHIHAVGLTAADYYAMAHDHAKMIWSPRSNVSLYGNTGSPQILARLGGTVALGTDWTYSGSATLVREMACAADWNHNQLHDAFTDEDIWRMATINGAVATETDDKLGSLAAGKLADIAVFAAAPGELHHAVIAATTDKVALVVRGGKPLSGEADAVEALGPACEAVTVCSKAFEVCAAREFGGMTFQTIDTKVGGTATPNPPTSAYPAIFCDAPAQEPTCVPSRPGSYNGPTATDADGDGVDDTTDNCPGVFNPIRPMDGTAQADVDGDHIGDACDPTPVGDDLDGDGIPNAMDKCPSIADPLQTDTDGDGKGDACDACPTTPNPDSVCPPSATTIPMIQSGAIAVGGAVLVNDAIVTGVDSKGFAAQDPTVADGVNAGVYVFVGAAPGVTVGQKVSFQGTVAEYFTLTEVNGTITAMSAGTPITPVSLTVAQAADEKYEGVLVTLSDVTQVTNPYDCAVDGACTDPMLWSVNTNGIVVWNPMYAGADWATEATAAATSMHPKVTGVMSFRFNKRRIEPRTAADITP